MNADASIPPTELAVTGLNCNNCARKVTDIIQGFAGVASVAVALEQGRATVRWKSGAQPELPALLEALQAAGYASRVIAADSTEPAARLGGWALNLILGIPVTLVLMLGEWVFQLGEVRWFAWAGFMLAGAVQVFAGAKFYRGAWAQLKVRNANMDTLVSLGSTTAFGYSAWALFAVWPGHLYFMEAASIITLISVGHWIEARVGEKAASSLKALLTLAPPTARRLAGSGTGVSPVRSSSPSPFAGIRSEFRLQAAPQANRLKAELQILSDPLTWVETEVPVAQLRIGDQVALRPGDRVPVDGEVIEGASAVDEAMLTGESAPVDKSARSALYAGTTNLNGRLVMCVTATGEATALAHIIAAVQRAQTSRANIQRLGDRVSNVFVPVVCIIALATALWWGLAYESAQQLTAWLAPFLWHAHPPASPLAAAVIAAAAVLIVACPCAMGLATPAAIMAAANAAARRGILIRDGVALEKAGQVTAVIFDKTGTLTLGKPVVVQTWLGGSRREEAPMELAATLAKNSTHPISQAIAQMPRTRPAVTLSASGGEKFHGGPAFAAEPTPAPSPEGNGVVGRSRNPAPLLGEVGGGLSQGFRERGAPATTDWREVVGAGVEARTSMAEGGLKLARLGSLRWLRAAGVNLAPGGAFANEWSAQGATIVGLAVENELLGLFAVQDALKPGAAAVVGQLQADGLKIFLVTGDTAATAAGIGQLAGIPPANLFAEARPEQKADFVKQLQARGERVAFVGDGINDAPALTQADLGVAVCRASDVAREAADIILLKSEVEAVPESLGLARATLRTIKQNLFWAFFYNAAAVPLAAMGFMSPVLCAAAMGASDLIVIANALRLRGWQRQRRPDRQSVSDAGSSTAFPRLE